MDAVLEQARAHGASRVHRIVLRIGTLSGVEPEALRFAFEVVSRDTMAADAELEVDSVQARAYCSACEKEFEAEGSYILSCPRCGRLSADIRQGRELELSRIEMS
jgi:hydrogenase nickel incorporation protein HypA/HybF